MSEHIRALANAENIQHILRNEITLKEDKDVTFAIEAELVTSLSSVKTELATKSAKIKKIYYEINNRLAENEKAIASVANEIDATGLTWDDQISSTIHMTDCEGWTICKVGASENTRNLHYPISTKYLFEYTDRVSLYPMIYYGGTALDSNMESKLLKLTWHEVVTGYTTESEVYSNRFKLIMECPKVEIMANSQFSLKTAILVETAYDADPIATKDLAVARNVIMNAAQRLHFGFNDGQSSVFNIEATNDAGNALTPVIVGFEVLDISYLVADHTGSASKLMASVNVKYIMEVQIATVKQTTFNWDMLYPQMGNDRYWSNCKGKLVPSPITTVVDLSDIGGEYCVPPFWLDTDVPKGDFDFDLNVSFLDPKHGQRAKRIFEFKIDEFNTTVTDINARIDDIESTQQKLIGFLGGMETILAKSKKSLGVKNFAKFVSSGAFNLLSALTIETGVGPLVFQGLKKVINNSIDSFNYHGKLEARNFVEVIKSGTENILLPLVEAVLETDIPDPVKASISKIITGKFRHVTSKMSRHISEGSHVLEPFTARYEYWTNPLLQRFSKATEKIMKSRLGANLLDHNLAPAHASVYMFFPEVTATTITRRVIHFHVGHYSDSGKEGLHELLKKGFKTNLIGYEVWTETYENGHWSSPPVVADDTRVAPGSVQNAVGLACTDANHAEAFCEMMKQKAPHYSLLKHNCQETSSMVIDYLERSNLPKYFKLADLYNVIEIEDVDTKAISKYLVGYDG